MTATTHGSRDAFLTRWVDEIEDLSGWRRDLVAFVAGAASVLTFAPVFLSPVLFLTLPILVWLIDSSASPRAAARAGWWFGFGYFFLNLFWIGEAFLVEADKFAVFLPFAVTLLPAGLAMLWAAAAAASRTVWPSGLARVLVLAIALAIAEWTRGHALTGLPWNVLGYALTAPIELMQSASFVGIYALTPIAVLIFASPLVLMSDAARRGRPYPVAPIVLVAIVPLAALYAFGWWRLSAPQEYAPGVRLRIVQPSVVQREKWMPEHQRRIFADHLALTVTNAAGQRDGAQGITHVLWPEAAMPFLPLEHPEALAAIAEALPAGTQLITGALRRESTDTVGHPLPVFEHKTFNGILVFDDAGRPTAQYDKIHLVPFGEYLPFEPLLSLVGLKKLTHGLGAFAVGSSPRANLAVAGLPPVLGIVCYEALFAGNIVQSPERPGLLVNVTNDGWFGDTTGPRQHFHQTRVRAVEEGVPLVRAANNGISGVVDRYGRVLQRIGMDVRGVIDSPLPSAAAATPYSRAGNWLFTGVLLVLGLIAAALARTSKVNTTG